VTTVPDRRRHHPMKPTGSLTAAGALLVFAAALLPVLLPAAAWARPFGLEDLARLVRIGDPQVAPDGRSVVIVVSRPNYDDNRYDSELVLVDVSTGAQRILTRDRRQLGHPRWSPTGDRLAFLAEGVKNKPVGDKGGAAKSAPAAPGDDSGRRQIFLMPMNGGDALQVTNAPEGVQQLAWRPDGGAIAYVSADEPQDREAAKKGEDGFEVGNNDYLAREAARPSHLWLVPSEGGAPQRLTSGPWSLPESRPPGPPSSPVSWSPDGRLIAFVRQEKPHFGDADRTSIQVLDLATGGIRPLTGGALLEGVPAFSPDGGQIAFWYPRDGDPNNVNEISIAPASGGEPRVVTRALDRNLCRSIWTPDGKALLVGGHDGTRVSLWLQPLDGEARRLNLGKVHPAWSFWVDVSVGRTGAIAFAGSEPQHPAELYYMPTAEAVPKRLTAFNEPLAALDLGKVESIEWNGPDGFKENGVLILPPGFDPSRKHSLVLLIHGGPTSSSTESFSTLGQLLAARGHVVFQPNYRGSDNLGNAFQRAIVNDAGDGPGRDVMAGLEAVKARGHVDPERIGVSGWSYGGYMTSWLIGHYDVFKVAVAGASVTDLMDQYNLSDFNVLERHIFGGSPWVDGLEKAYREQSPITYASKVKAPTLILSTTGDARVPVTQSYRLYHALMDNGVRTRFVAWPVAGHFPSDPVRARSVWRTWLEWLDEHLVPMPGESPAPPPGEPQPPLTDEVSPAPPAGHR